MSRIDPKRWHDYLEHGPESLRQRKTKDYLVLVFFKDGSMRELYTHTELAAVQMTQEFWKQQGGEVDRIVVGRVILTSTDENNR